MQSSLCSLCHCAGLLSDEFARIGDPASQSARGDGRWRSEEHLGFFMTHAAWEIAVRSADAFQRHVHAAERIDRTAEAGCATGILGHLHTCIDENGPD